MRWLRGGISAVMGTLLLEAPILAASVPISRQSSLEASGKTSLDEFLLSEEFSEFGLFDLTLARSLSGAGNGGTTQASARQRSDVNPVTLVGFASGRVQAQVAELDAIVARASSAFTFVFDVIDSAETLTLQGRVESTFDSSARIVLSREDSATLFQQIVDFGEQDRLDFDEAVLLEPGRYTLIAEGLANGTPSFNTADFDVQFALSNPIPIAPAVWSGGTGLIVAMAVKSLMKRSARRHPAHRA